MSSIKDVAEKAGVSIKTVSRVLSSPELVSEKTYLKIKEVMNELEYYPSAAAQSLRGQKKGVVCVIAEDLTTSPDSFELIAGIQSECDKHGKLLMIGESGGNQQSFENLVNDFRQQRAQAIIFATKFHKEVKIEKSFNKCPLILVNCYEKTLRHPTILPNDKLGAFELTHKLLSLGHKRIAYLTLFKSMSATVLRTQGFIEAHKIHNVDLEPALIIEAVTNTNKDELANLEQIIEQLINSNNPPSAILCGNDKMAMRAFMLIRRKGLRIPEDITVVGYDDYKLISENLVPNLTTVSLPYFEMGSKAARLAIQEDIHNEIYNISGDVVWRDSHQNILT